jgi:two-component system NtrC family sensor kinase
MDEQVRILCVDDEKKILTAIKRSFLDNDFEILNATSGPEGLEILRRVTPIQVVVSDFRMPGMNGVDFLKEVCKCWPETVRIIISGFADTAAIISAINEGKIFRFIPKPWNEDHLKTVIFDAIKQYCYHQENMELTQELRRKDIELQGMKHKFRDLQDIFSAFPIAVVSVDLNGMILHCNKKGSELFGKEGQEVIGMNRSDLFPDEMNTFIERLIQKGSFSEQFSLGNDLFRMKGSRIRGMGEKEAMILIFDRVNG